MAQFVPELTQAVLNNMATAGERKVAKFLSEYLDDDCIVWCNVPMGNKRLYADFLVLFPNKGLLCIEVKDWHLKILRRMTKTECELEIDGHRKREKHPMEQARSYVHTITNLLSSEKRLQQQDGDYQGRLILPYTQAVIFTQFTHSEISNLSTDKARLDILMPIKNTLYKDDLKSGQSKEKVLTRLWDTFQYDFEYTLNREEIDLIRWHLFPEIRLNLPEQQELFNEQKELSEPLQLEEAIPPKPIIAPDIIKIMDIQQEQLARSMGGGHRVIHGVAGSGKTLILLMRSQYLAKQAKKPILILCFNIALAAKLRTFIADKKLTDKIKVHHFHGWCSYLCKEYNLDIAQKYQRLPHYEQFVQTAIDAMQDGRLPENIYEAVLIDEGHDFDADWLRLATYTLDKQSNYLLLLYDDAQSIYKNNKNLGFSLASVGIKAQGRTTILRLNYRNTKEIIGFAYLFAQNKMRPRISNDENQIPLVEPEAAGLNGVSPYIKQCASWQDELAYLERCLDKWLLEDKIPLQDIAIICYRKEQCDEVSELLKRKKIKYCALQNSTIRKKYNPNDEAVTVCTMHSSKGLEFQRVMLMGIYSLENKSKAQETEYTRLLYVAMTRAQSYLMITLSGTNIYSQRLLESYYQFKNNN
ncbi:3'-5' exonuclease [Neisseria montereyensis]|uniref:DNA 3'-5' helicase n=1 Tax=Neisseria montereyensis TaxID=2973938 RepID=A0ABT2FA34_9NEIS|nr:3'-5' exonuclease [Neisseria montereyensis]MCS4533037.1 NERD domain-containing protein [Neisseria montereyensis]